MEPECEATTETPRLIQDAKALMQASSVLLTQEGAGATGAAEEEDAEFSDTEAEVNHIADFGEAHATRRTTTRECLAAEEVLASVHLSTSRDSTTTEDAGVRASCRQLGRSTVVQGTARCVSPGTQDSWLSHSGHGAPLPSTETPPVAMLRHRRWCGLDVFQCRLEHGNFTVPARF